jgi:hypothetical protein
MASLERTLRKDLERAVKKARNVAEAGARQAIAQLGVGDPEAPKHLTAEQRALRNGLRAHSRILGDRRDSKTGAQVTIHLAQECAYEHWHRMLFARFLAETDLLIEPESGVAITLEEVQELARENGTDWLPLASDYAERMLPQIFRKDDPVLDIALPPETRSELEDLLKALPKAVFEADDSLGWVYQFWQAEKKEEVNHAAKSGLKIGADELPAVTQLFTEDYMVLFLLHNTLGAWWAGKVLARNPALAASASSEEALRAACRVGDVDWAYLRFVRDTADDGANGSWRPAAGAFEGWPKAANDITVLDPCMGSGHFLAFALPILVAFRTAEEFLSERDAIDSVLRDNLFGLEIDPRCTQIAAFNLAFAAWRMAGYRQLPPMHLACSGLAIGVSKTEWLRLGERAAALADPGAKSDLLGTETTLLNAGVDARVRTGLERMYDLFARAPWLGSLIDPRQAGADIFAADFDALEPFLKRALADDSEELAEMAVSAQGLAKAADLLAKQYVLVATNVPYLGRHKQDDVLRKYSEEIHEAARADLASCLIDRATAWLAVGGSLSIVSPQSWLFQPRYKKFRETLLKMQTWNVFVQIGEGGFESSQAAGAFVSLIVLSASPPNNCTKFSVFDIASVQGVDQKKQNIKSSKYNWLIQENLRKNPDSRIVTQDISSIGDKLSQYADCYQGLRTGDKERFVSNFWEHPAISRGWMPLRTCGPADRPGSGNSHVVFWEDGRGQLSGYANETRDRLHDMHESGNRAWGRGGVAIAQVRTLSASLYGGERFDNSLAVIYAKSKQDAPGIAAYCLSDEYTNEVRKLDTSLNVTNATLLKVPFDLPRWQTVAAAKYPGGFPNPHSEDPTQWLFNGHPRDSDEPLQVAVARMVGYRWPRQTGSSFMECPAATEPDGLESHSDPDGIVCLTALKGEQAAEERLNALLAAAFGVQWSAARLSSLLDAAGFAGKTLDDWLRDGFFEQHCALFHQRPFIWHVWDGRRDGFHALVNYHHLAGSDGEGRRTLEKLIYSYLGDWIDSQRDAQKRGVEGADGRLAAAEHLKTELEKVRDGEAPYDIFVRWKPVHRQPIGWEPDINDGVRLNIRPFLTARLLTITRRGDPCILRVRPKGSEFNNIGKADRGKEPHRDRIDFPWFWNWQPESPDFATDFAGGATFDGNRWNDLHYSRAVKEAARDRHAGKAGTKP